MEKSRCLRTHQAVKAAQEEGACPFSQFCGVPHHGKGPRATAEVWGPGGDSDRARSRRQRGRGGAAALLAAARGWPSLTGCRNFGLLPTPDKSLLFACSGFDAVIASSEPALERKRKGKKRRKGRRAAYKPRAAGLVASCLGTGQLLPRGAGSWPRLQTSLQLGGGKGLGTGGGRGRTRGAGGAEGQLDPHHTGDPPRTTPVGAGRSLPWVSSAPCTCSPAPTETSKHRAAWKGRDKVSLKRPKVFLATSAFRPALSGEGKIVVKTTSVWFPQITTFLVKNETGRKGVSAASS